ncbi:MAG: tetratricopeptide repeat protein [Flavobacteriales bacterium]
MKKLFFLLFILFSFHGRAQLNKDSLYSVWKDEKQTDSVRLMAMWFLCYDCFLFNNPDTSYKLAQQMYDFAKKTGQLKFQGHALGTQGAACYYLGKHDLSIECHKRSLQISTKLGNKGAQASALNNIANVFRDQGKAADALIYFRKSLKLNEQLNNKLGISTVMGNIGAVYSDQNDFKNARIWYERAYALKKELKDPLGISLSLASIGNCYADEKMYDSAMVCQKKALAIRKTINNKDGMAYCYHSIGEILEHQGILDSALIYYHRSLALFDELKSNPGITDICHALCNAYRVQGQYKKAIPYGKRALKIARESGLVESIRNACGALFRCYKLTGQYNNALDMYEFYILMRDSILRTENQQALIQQQFQYEYDKKSISDSLDYVQQQKVKEIAHTSELKHEQNQRYILYGGMAFLFLLGALVFRSYRLKRKDNLLIAAQKKEVERQKELVEEKNHEILDSINYAKRIQDAILPPDEFIKSCLPDSFILYKPKDIVAGDFYWLESVESDNDKQPVSHIIFAAADCTGHGVPGAMVSVVCHNALNRSVREFGLTDPGKILDKTRALVVEQFGKTHGEVKDGMDISLCSIKFRNKVEKVSEIPNPPSEMSLQWAGANNPLWILRNGQLIEFSPDKQPIGYSDTVRPFTTHSVSLLTGDIIYIFTDGYQDQFGGPKGKKFKASDLKELLLSIRNKSMNVQKSVLDETLTEWKDELEQVDDICIIGVRLS